VELAFFQALQLELILHGMLRKAGNDIIKVAVLEMQLIDALPQRFAIGHLRHGRFLLTDLTMNSIDLKKTKNEVSPRGVHAKLRRMLSNGCSTATAPVFERSSACRSSFT
jgi:hypothetical protein